MQNHTPLTALALLALAFAGCSKHSPDTTSTPQTNSFTQVGTNHYVQIGTNHFRLVNAVRITNAVPQTNEVTK
jgi:hypothetical protein